MTPSEPSRSDADERASGGPEQTDAARRSRERREAWQGLDQASVMSVELLAAVFTWGGLGWLADRWLDTNPWFMGIGVLVGFGSGLYLVWLRSRSPEDKAAARNRRTTPARTDDRTEGSDGVPK